MQYDMPATSRSGKRIRLYESIFAANQGGDELHPRLIREMNIEILVIRSRTELGEVDVI